MDFLFIDFLVGILIVNISDKEQQLNFENMMRLAEYAAEQHKERRNTIFRIFISYMTLLVIIIGLIMKYWNYAVLEKDNLVFIAILFLGLLLPILIWYWRWLIVFYRAADNDVRRRSFYLQKAQVISYYMSKGLSEDFRGCEPIYLNLANRKSRKISEKCLFKQRNPDICPETCEEKTSPPSVRGNRHFIFHLFSPCLLTIFILLILLGKLLLQITGTTQ